MSQSLRIVFAGTPAFAAAHLKQLIESNHDVVAVYTQPDRPSGRGKQLTPSPVKQLALDHGLSVLQPPTLRNEEATSELAAFNAYLWPLWVLSGMYIFAKMQSSKMSKVK